MKDVANFAITGFYKIYDPITKEILVDKQNAIHYENMSIALTQCFSNNGQGFAYELAFGNGGTAIDPTGIITYLTPNSLGINAGLYNQTYSKVIDDSSSNNLDPSRNYTEIRHVSGTNYTDLFATCLLDYGEPNGQMAFDNSTNNNGLYVFDEMGIKSYSLDNSLLLTHAIFHPVQKALNRLIQIDYTIRILSLTGV